MRVINATKLDGVYSATSFKGDLALREVHLWPGWCKPTNVSLFSYEYKNQRVRVPIEKNKTYTFDTIQKLIKKHLDIVIISHKDGKVTLTIRDPLLKIQFCQELVEIFKLPKIESYSTTISRNPDVDISKIKLTFNDCDLVYLRCAEIEKTNILENSVNSDLIAVIPLEKNRISFRDFNPLFHPLTKKRMIYDLHFSFEDSQGNALPFQKFILTLLNKSQ